MKTLFFQACAFLALSLPVFAEVIGVEQFDYPDGALAGKNGGIFWDYKNTVPPGRSGTASTWSNLNGAPNVASGRLVTSGNGAVKRAYNGNTETTGAINDANVAKTVYYRVNVTTGPSVTAGDYFGISSMDGGTEKLYFGKRGTFLNWGVEEVGVGGTNGSLAVLPNTTYTLVVQVDLPVNVIRLYVNPNLSAAQFSNSATASQDYTGTAASTAVRFAAGTAVTWDNLVIATTWEDLRLTVVTTLADEDNGSITANTSVSLREAVKYSPTGSLITFDSSLSGQTIMLTHAEGDLEIPGALTIDASALPGGLTVSGNNTSRHFLVGSGKSLALRGLTLTGGNGAGAGNNNGYGGAINNNGGTLTLMQCTLSGNIAEAGGAIFNDGTLTLTQCLLSGNATVRLGSAIRSRSTLTLSHCTLTENTPCGIMVEQGSCALSHCTITGNTGNGLGGGLRVQALTSVSLSNCIIAGNTDRTANDISREGTLTATGSNLIGSNATVESIFSTGSLVGTQSSPLDPKLSPLGYFGGPVQTVHPLIGSPAIDAAGSIDPGGTDARGFPRCVDGDTASAGAQLDIGAVEAGPLRTVDSVGGASTTGLRATILASTEPGARIGFLSSVFPATPIEDIFGTFTIAAGRTFFIDASSLSGPVTISGRNLNRVFNIPATATLAMHSVRIVNGNPGSANGGGILNEGTCTMMLSVLSGNLTNSGGCGIYNNGTCKIISTSLSANTCSGNGAGIFNNGTCSVISSTVSGNKCSGNGGGILNNGTCNVISSTIAENDSGRGSGIYNAGGICTVISSTLSSNVGSGITNDSTATMTVQSSIVAGNEVENTDDDFSGISGNNFLSGDPLLLPLGDYGGPTQTMALRPGSLARGAGGASARTPDQRGFPIVGTPDIGAYEAQISPIADVNMLENTVPPTRTFPVGQIGTLTADSTNTTLVPIENIEITGTGASRDVTVTPAVGQFGTCIITITEDLHGEQQTFQFEVTEDPRFIVTSSNNGDPGSLRVALATAASTPGPNTIRFDPNLAGPIELSSQLLIGSTDPVTIDASNLPNGMVLDGRGVTRHFQINAGETLTLRGLTLSGGNGSGSAGGSILNFGSAFLSGCTISHNTATTGGAFFLLGSASTMVLSQCTIAHNSSTTLPSTGGILASAGSLTLLNCTVSRNIGNGDGGGLQLQGTARVNVTNCIISENTDPVGNRADINRFLGTLTASGTNLIGSNQSVENIFPAGPLVGTAAAPLNADLSPLGDYGGPTATLPPNVNSPAIDQASTLSPALTTDQRGLPRPMGIRLDIGAVESSVIIVTTPVDELDPEGIIGNGISLREAVRDIPAGGTIGFDRAVFNSLTTYTITLTKGPLNPQQECTVDHSDIPFGIYVQHAPEFTQPQSVSAAAGDAVSFTAGVTAISGGVEYLWFKDYVATGTTTETFSIPSAQEADEGLYHLEVWEVATGVNLTMNGVLIDPFTMVTQPASLVVDGAPAVTFQKQARGAMLFLGQHYELSVIAIGPPPLKYQWFKAGKAIPGATKSSYVIPKAALSHAGAYTCVVKSGLASMPSTTAEIGVVDTRYKVLNLKAGSKFTSTAIAAGNGLNYQWYRGVSQSLIGETNKMLTPINSLSVADSAYYDCKVTGPSGNRYGGRVQLKVTNAAPALVTPLNLPPAYIGQDYSYPVPVQDTAGAEAVSFSVSGSLPSGMTFDKTLGLLSGRPTVTKSAGYALSFKAINASGSSPAANVTLKVNVVPPSAVGVFAGPLERSPLNDNLGGRFDLTTTGTGLCSGSVTLGARAKLSFTNQLLLSAGAGDAILRVNIPGLTMADKTPLTAYLEVFATDQTARLTLLHPNGGTLLATAWRNSWSKTRPATAYASTYTARLDPANIGTAPRGYGFATLLVKPDGTLTLTGKLPDGSGLTQAGFVGPEGQLTVFNLLHTKRGSLVGSMQLVPETPVAENTLGGTLDWLKLGPLPKSTDTVYQAGFGPLAVTVEGSPYIAPAKGQRVLGLGITPNPNAKLDFTLGGLEPDFTQLLHITNPSATGLTNKGTLTLPLTNATKLTTLDAAKGQFKGSYVINGSTVALNRPAPFFGQIVKIGATTQGYGFFLLPSVPVGAQKVTTSPKLSGRVVLGAP